MLHCAYRIQGPSSGKVGKLEGAVVLNRDELGEGPWNHTTMALKESQLWSPASRLEESCDDLELSGKYTSVDAVVRLGYVEEHTSSFLALGGG